MGVITTHIEWEEELTLSLGYVLICLMITSRFLALPQELQDTIFSEVKKIGTRQTALKYASQVKLHWITLYNYLLKHNSGGAKKKYKYQGGKFVEEKELVSEELEFIEKLRRGEATLEETSRLVAANVFTQMLKYPDKFQFLDFFRSELLKIKKEESEMKENWAKELINRMFMGKLPPRNCPKCGFNLSENIVEGEIVNEPIQLSDRSEHP